VEKLELQSSRGDKTCSFQDISIMVVGLCQCGIHLELLGKYMRCAYMCVCVCVCTYVRRLSNLVFGDIFLTAREHFDLYGDQRIMRDFAIIKAVSRDFVCGDASTP
jgi:hypothetical protein